MLLFINKINNNQRNKTEVLPETTKLKRKAASSEETKKTNLSSLLMCVLNDCAIAFRTTPRVSENEYFFSMGR